MYHGRAFYASHLRSAKDERSTIDIYRGGYGRMDMVVATLDKPSQIAKFEERMKGCGQDLEAKDMVMASFSDPSCKVSMCDLCGERPWNRRLSAYGIETLVCFACLDEENADHRDENSS